MTDTLSNGQYECRDSLYAVFDVLIPSRPPSSLSYSAIFHILLVRMTPHRKQRISTLELDHGLLPVTDNRCCFEFLRQIEISYLKHIFQRTPPGLPSINELRYLER